MVKYPANNTNSEDIINITTSDDESKEENESISPPTSYSAGMHTSGDDTDGEDNPNLFDTDEDNNERNQTIQDVEDNDLTQQQNNGTILQENVKDRKREDLHTNNPHEAMGNSSVGLTDESEADLYMDLPALTTDSPDTDTDDTGYDETRHSPNIWIEDSLIHNTELDNFIQAAIKLAPNDLPMSKMKQLSQWF